MTLQSSSSNSEIVSASGPSSTTSSTSTSSTDVFPLPYSIGHKEIVLNNEARTVVADVGENNILSTPGANVSIVESSDVHLGNRTNFNGEVTIYQYINGPNIPNGSVGQDEVECKKTVNINIPESKISWKRGKKWSKKEKCFIYVGTLAVYSLIAIITSYLVAFSSNDPSNAFPEKPCPIVSESSSDADVFVPRNLWGGVEPIYFTKIPPAVLVVIKHTRGPLCSDICACSLRVREMQRRDMVENNLSDIRYNFLIGGDGRIYEGRSWAVQNEGRNDSLDIAFIGNFSENIPSKSMVNLAHRIIAKATWMKALHFATFVVVNHNQTEATDSPGEELFKKVTTWQFYSDKLFFMNSSYSTIRASTAVPGSDADVFIPRETWGGVKPVNITKISPVALVVIKHTGGTVCNNIKSCSARVREIQRQDMEKNNMADIRYNFLVGGDGRIYIGRGWSVKNEGKIDSLDIAFIGNFTLSKPTLSMIRLAKRIILRASWMNALDYSAHEVINHNQTELTDSPGENLFREVTTWQSYSDSIYYN